jgi:hypothetical protein
MCGGNVFDAKPGMEQWLSAPPSGCCVDCKMQLRKRLPVHAI